MVSSEALCAALLVCEALEEFRMEWPGQRRLVTNPLIFISLGDAVVARPWACTKIRHLEVAFGIAASSPLLRPSDNPYYNRLPGCILSVEEQEQLGMLERLYRQIVILTQLSYLDLRMLALNEQGFPTVTPCGQNIFPALLSLGDGETGRPGYLALWGRLTKLRVLRGSVNANTDEARVTMGWREARWMAAHWHELEVAEFSRKGEDPTEPLLWLQEQYKEHRLMVSPKLLFWD
ncbi:hypothetical protein BGX23_004001 [Mortierella sp. AD031]|nr:hypothetical protein BGX23_004001 [Mortierella sp. AD031]